MSEWRQRRFWKLAEPVKDAGGWGISLDGRVLKTPVKSSLVVPTVALAKEIAAEWNAQESEIDPLSMPFTRSANAAIDKVAPQKPEVAALIAAYGETDLLCYRADQPEALVKLQAEAWDPLLDWAKDALQAPLTVTSGIVPVAQSPAVVKTLHDRVGALDDHALTAMHDLVSLSGSLILGFAGLEGVVPFEELWRLSRIDESWQESQWGTDEEATELATRKRADFLHAGKFFLLSRPAA